MNIACSPTVATFALSTLVIEPVLVAVVSAFWMLFLPFVGLSLAVVKIWSALTKLGLRRLTRANPLILRRGPAKDASAPQHQGAATTAHV